jgi:hypothetical protein
LHRRLSPEAALLSGSDPEQTRFCRTQHPGTPGCSQAWDCLCLAMVLIQRVRRNSEEIIFISMFATISVSYRVRLGPTVRLRGFGTSIGAPLGRIRATTWAFARPVTL